MKSRPASANFGVEFYDVDLATIDDDQLETIREAQNEHGVVFFRDQNLTPLQHLEFSQRCGNVVRNRFFETVDGYDEIAMVRKQPKHTTVVGGAWHTDHSYEREPAKGSLLMARALPKKGGDTLFANMYAAYEALPMDVKRSLEGMRAVHSIAHKYDAAVVQEKDDRFPNGTILDVSTTTHPVVVVHPDSGKKALYVNPDLTIRFEGWTKEQSAPLLNFLCTHSLRDCFTMRFQWSLGSIAFWDNRATMHCACNDYPNETRIMHRVTLMGCPLAGPELKPVTDKQDAASKCQHLTKLCIENVLRWEQSPMVV